MIGWGVPRKHTLPKIRPTVKRKLPVFATGGLVPIFDPFRRVALQPKGEPMSMISRQYLPTLPFPPFAGMEQKTYAAWPVWSDSTTKEIKFQPIPVATRNDERSDAQSRPISGAH
jgi:hypothetical protein